MAFAEMPAASQWSPGWIEDRSDHTTHLQYRGHTIRTCPVQEVDGYCWVAAAVITRNCRYEANAVTVEVWLSRLHVSEEAAQARAVEIAKQWIDNKLDHG